MNNALSKYVEAANGLTQLTKARAETIVKQLVKQGEVATGQAGELVEDLLEKSKRNREQVSALVKSETKRAVKAMGLATTNDVEKLQGKVRDLEKQLAAASAPAAEKSSAKKSPAKKSTAKKSS